MARMTGALTAKVMLAAITKVGDVIVNPPPEARIDKSVGSAVRTAVATGAAPRPARMQASPVA